MLLLGHVGITLGTAMFLFGVLGSNISPNTKRNRPEKPPSHSYKNTQTTNDFQSHKKSRLTLLGRHLDLRFLLMGSLLPDMIDRPIGMSFFRETFSNGRIFCHTLLLPVLVTVAGFKSFRHQNSNKNVELCKQ